MSRSWAVILPALSALLFIAAPSSLHGAGRSPEPRRLLVKSATSDTGRTNRRSHPVTARGRTPVTPSGGWTILDVPPGESVEAFALRMSLSGDYESVEVDRFARISPRVPDDLSHNQWSLDNVGQSVNGTRGLYDADIDAPEAWELETGRDTVIVAVLDTGVGSGQADLADNLLAGIDLIQNGGPADDDAGTGHGTPVAGIIGALGNNGVGMSGINWSAGILPIKVCDKTGYCPYSAIISGINEAVRRGARVINLSVTCDEHRDAVTGQCGGAEPGSCYSGALRETIEAAGRAGVLVVTAAGNCGEDIDDATRAYPCAYDLDNLICVGATDSRDEVAAFSNHGASSVHIGAPGTQVISLSTQGGELAFWDGTSFAAPMVSGVAALQLARNAELTPAAVKERILGGDERAWLSGAFAGGKRLNAYETLHDLFLTQIDLGQALRSTPVAVGDFDGDGMADALSMLRNGSVKVSIGTGSGLQPGETWSVAKGRHTPFAGDVNGDGRDDIVLESRGGRTLLLSSGSSFSSAPASSAPRRGLVLEALADVDGDGRSDLILETRSGVSVSLSRGVSFSPEQPWFPGRRGDRAYADVNGDGLADLILVSGGRVDVALSDGVRFGPATSWGESTITRKLLVGDVDGDGLEDLAVETGNCWNLLLSRGDSFTPPRPWACGDRHGFSRLVRFDADARADLVQVKADRWTLSRSAP